MTFAVGAKTDVGRGRPANEDTFLVNHEDRLYAVADGMGGHRAGEVASATAIDALQAAFADGASLDQAVEEANAAVYEKASANLDMRGMGTTLTAAVLLDDRHALLGHVGDSRAYLMRDGGVTQITEDHSLVEQLVREGRLSPEEAADHPQKAIITRALGIDPDVEVDTYPIDLRPGDRLLLCSDGLTNMLNDAAIARVLRRQPDPQEAAEQLVDMANEAGGDDNITVVVIDALGDSATEGAAASGALGERLPEEPTEEWFPFEEAEEVAPAPAEASPPAAAGVSGRRGRRARRALVWLLPVILLFGAGLGALGWYARRTYYVGLGGDRVTLYRGVPGGVLGWDPTVEERSGLIADDLTPAQRADLESGHRFANRSDALRYLRRLEEERTPPPIVSDPPTTVPTFTVNPGPPAKTPSTIR
ncbi:MAG: Stp1/IreP family PP2C-type Ser/Thr phosphatase [Actinomycetota bacterium]|nr:Stp1/IreP family PP2C-type Ser/Thr phosphatase [Actinomycetota bacterium]